MTDSVIILPVIRVERIDQAQMQVLRVPVTPATLKRLTARAKEWGISIENAASGILDEAMRPPKRRGR
jgi:hypothetical protein